MQRVKIAHSFLVCVKSVPRYHFKPAYVFLQMAVKEFFETHKKMEKQAVCIGLYFLSF